jgi:hypothetical protein
MLTQTTYQKVGFFSEKSGKCIKCGKRRQRRKEFYQTINPFNKNREGLPKTREEIYRELLVEKEDWQKEPIICNKCL